MSPQTGATNGLTIKRKPHMHSLVHLIFYYTLEYRVLNEYTLKYKHESMLNAI